MSSPPRRSSRSNKGKPPARYLDNVEVPSEAESSEGTEESDTDFFDTTVMEGQQQTLDKDLMAALMVQITALKQSVDDLRKETGVNQTETQRLREAFNDANALEHRRPRTEETQSTTPPSSSPSPAATSNVGIIQPYKKLYDLPTFSGKPEDWPLFLANYEETTSNFRYTDMENTIRLQKCLQGEALDAVRSLLIHPSNLEQVIKTLSFRFGRADVLVKAQLQKIQQFPNINDARVEQIIPFTTMVENVVAFLRAAKCEQHLANPMLLEELVLKLPLSRRFEWAKKASDITPYPTIKDFATWLSEQAKIIQLLPQPSTSVVARSQVPHARRMFHTNERNVAVPRNTTRGQCVCCGGNHQMSECGTFRGLTISDRWKLVKNKHLCFSCIKPGHGTATCRNKRRCNENACAKYHHKLLHEETISLPAHSSAVETTSTSPQEQDVETNPTTSQACIRMHTCQTQNTIAQLFRILPVILTGPRGEMRAYAMFDEGSSTTILEEGVADELGLKGQVQPLTLQWYGEQVVTEPSRKVAVEVQGVGKGDQRFSLRNVRTVKDLSLPNQSFNKDSFAHLNDVPVCNYTNAKPVLMIGLDNCHLGVARVVIEDMEDKVIAAHTKLGWVAYGPQYADNNNMPVVMHIKEAEALSKLDKIVEAYFSVENFGVRKVESILESVDDNRARQMLKSTTKRVGKRFETGLLWRQDDTVLPDSLKMATSRLYNIEAKMRRDPEFAILYQAQMNSYVEKGYARQLMPEELQSNNSRTWYLPHFGVTSHHKPGKLRIVFDASAEVTGISLNSTLLKGPEQAKSLLSVLFQFRQGVVGVVADIREMFSQINIRPADQVAQRFLWRDGKTDKQIKTYVMTSMIFGAACSPCSAEYIKNKNAKEFEKESPEAVRRILDNHYVDDFVCSFASESEAEQVSLDVKRIHAEGGFELRSFVSNRKTILSKLNDSWCPVPQSVSLESDNEIEKVLGMYWDHEDDTFRFCLKFHRIAKDVLEATRPPTKREVLGIVMAVFDPYGFLANFLIYSKILLQTTWKTGIGWDDPLPPDLHHRWILWWLELSRIKQFKVSRCYSPKLSSAESIELHIFVDASESAFAAVGYFRIQCQGEVDVAFVSGKTRCAPKKLLSIPRLELQAAVLGSRLQTTIRANHNVSISRVVFWSDSKTNIWWFRSANRRYKPFVAHRVAEILDTSESSDWYWLPSELNVADDATRATYPPIFIANSRWIVGPEFLRLPEQRWPNYGDAEVPDTLLEEIRPRMLHISQASRPIIHVANFSSFNKLRRTVAWVLRGRAWLSRARVTVTARQQRQPISECYIPTSVKNSAAVPKNAITATEIVAAEKFLCCQAQKDDFYEERSRLEKGLPVAISSTIYQLTPYLDEDKLLRLGGRINAAYCLPAEARCPVILPQCHPLTQLIVYHYHDLLHHQNDALTINEIRQRYWVPRIRSVLKRARKNCQSCKLARAKPATPLMGQLPVDRLTPFIRPFTYTGLDYFGPLQVAIGRRREKRWVALFTCLTIRAIHLELATDLSTDALILCLRNFVNRRGTPIRIRCDNGTNFIGAQRELAKEARLFDFDAIQGEMSAKRIDWRFNCPLNPSEGGIWERMVQSVKKILLVTLREEAPRVETLRSLLIEAENIVNSRPLTELPVSSEEDEPLTPNHFLIGCVNSTQTPNIDDTPICSRKQWKISQQLKDRFWKRWILEYLPILTKRSKWHAVVPPLKVGDLIVICDAGQPRRKWQRGRITKVYPAKDGQIRSADVKTPSGILRRPASKLAVLEVSESPRVFTEGGMSSSTNGSCNNAAIDH